MTTNPAADLTPTMRALLVNAKQGGTTLYRGGLDLANGYAPANILRAFAARGLVELHIVTVEVYSKARTHYRGKRQVLDHATLTDAGHAVRLALLAELPADE